MRSPPPPPPRLTVDDSLEKGNVRCLNLKDKWRPTVSEAQFLAAHPVDERRYTNYCSVAWLPRRTYHCVVVLFGNPNLGSVPCPWLAVSRKDFLVGDQKEKAGRNTSLRISEDRGTTGRHDKSHLSPCVCQFTWLVLGSSPLLRQCRSLVKLIVDAGEQIVKEEGRLLNVLNSRVGVPTVMGLSVFCACRCRHRLTRQQHRCCNAHKDIRQVSW